MKSYTIDTEALREYVRYLKNYRRGSESARKKIGDKLTTVHADWDDRNYELTVAAMDEIDSELGKLYLGLDEALKWLQDMTDKYEAYANRRRK